MKLVVSLSFVINNQLFKKVYVYLLLVLQQPYFYSNEKSQENSSEVISVRSEQVHFHILDFLGMDVFL